jgi:sigma-54 specific flagellar transcriptional regulator A
MALKPAHILVISDDQLLAREVAVLLDASGEILTEATQIASFANWDNQIQITTPFAVWVVMQATESFHLALKTLSHLYPHIPVMLIESNALMMRPPLQGTILGTLVKPFKHLNMQKLLHQCQIFHEQQIGVDVNAGQSNVTLFRSLVGRSPAIERLRQMITHVSDTEVNVLLLGPSGSGKEVVARNIHYLSSRRQGPFVPINCGAIPGELLESELFGHEKGAFTGALTARKGRFELADGGTLFLDEIGDMPLLMQVKLLRVLQERVVERVGSNKSIEVNVRIIAATHRNLEEAIQAGTFREDLYFRLNVFPIDVPALRERQEDLPVLVEDLLTKVRSENRPTTMISDDAIERLSHYDWPGNVRELANLIERLCILYPGGKVGINELPPRFSVKSSTSDLGLPEFMPTCWSNSKQTEARTRILVEAELPPDGIDLKKHIAKLEVNYIQQALQRSDGVVAHAAQHLKMRRTTLVEKMKKYGMSRLLQEETQTGTVVSENS